MGITVIVGKGDDVLLSYYHLVHTLLRKRYNQPPQKKERPFSFLQIIRTPKNAMYALWVSWLLPLACLEEPLPSPFPSPHPFDRSLLFIITIIIIIKSILSSPLAKNQKKPNHDAVSAPCSTTIAS